MLLGAHLSIAGGLHRAIERAHRCAFDCVAVFVRNQVQWKSPPLSSEAIGLFRAARRRLGIKPVVAHGSYLINLAGRADVRRKSIAAVREDLGRCQRLGIEYLVLHPGSREQADRGIALIADALNSILGEPAADRSPPPTRILLETTAGQGNSIGGTFEQIAAILGLLDRPRPFGVCLDTCHVFAAGYDIRTPVAYRNTMAAFDRIVGLENLLAIHLSDSRRALGCRVDRHEHIGCGQIGLKGFANLVRDRRLARVPMILETPKGSDKADRDWDELNALRLRRIESRSRCSGLRRQRSRPGGRADTR